MKLTPNISRKTRISYVVMGAALVAIAWLAPFLDRALAFTVVLLGGISVVEGIVGF